MGHTAEWATPTEMARVVATPHFQPPTMPAIRSQKSLDAEHQEGRIQLALHAYKKGDFSSIHTAASAFQIPRNTLTRRLAGTPQRATLRANSHKLTEMEEQSFINWIYSMDSHRLVPKKQTVYKIANLLLAKREDTTSQNVGQNWITKYAYQLLEYVYCIVMIINILNTEIQKLFKSGLTVFKI